MTHPSPPDAARADFQDGAPTEIYVTRAGREMRMLGPAGAARELSFVPDEERLFGPDADFTQKTLPVLVGSGTGAALERLVGMLSARYGDKWSLAVVDKEEDILAASEVRRRFAKYPGIVFLPALPSDPAGDAANAPADAPADAPAADAAAHLPPEAQRGQEHAPPAHDAAEALHELTRWQTAQGGKQLLAVSNPFYLRIDRPYYNAVITACDTSRKADFWDKARYPKFKGSETRILLLTSKYFLMGEIIAACERLDIPTHLLVVPEDGIGCNEFIEALLTAVLEFKPDFIFTINHLGVDREGLLADLLARLRLPLASWFVDNPHLILYLYDSLVSPWTSIFTWDADNLSSVGRLGFTHVTYLPLGVDAHRFTPVPPGHQFAGLPPGWNGGISFVGNSMVEKVRENRDFCPLPDALLHSYEQVAAAFAESEERSIRTFLATAFPDLTTAFDQLPDVEAQQRYETMLTWEATRQYRLSCVRGIMGFEPLVVGDKGWRDLLTGKWHYHSELNYYSDLPAFYPCSAVNFNCTSKQMKGAVNQRVFDVPATNSFLLTDYREQIENLFEPGREVVLYHSPEEAGSLAKEYLAAPEKRQAVALAARKRILAEHTYEHRVRSLIAEMKRHYG